MTDAFQNISFDLDLKSDNTEAFVVLEELNSLSETNHLRISAQAHITKANKEQVIAKIAQLGTLGVIDNNKMNTIFNTLK